MEQNQSLKHFWLYVLLLERGKYYVGISTQPDKRFMQHKTGIGGAAWTHKYKVVKELPRKDLGFCTLDDAELYENKIVRIYIRKYSLDNVRGGDITYTGKYYSRFGRFVKDTDWEVITSVTFLTILMLIVLVLYFQK